MRKRSKYRPKGIRIDTVGFVVGGLQPALSHKAATPVRIRNHAAMTALTTGAATKSDIDVLISAFNIAEALASVNPKLGSDWAQEIKAGQDALFNVALRGKTSHKFVLSGPEMVAMNLVLDIHEAQLEHATVLDMERAADLVRQRIQNKQARKITAV